MSSFSTALQSVFRCLPPKPLVLASPTAMLSSPRTRMQSGSVTQLEDSIFFLQRTIEASLETTTNSNSQTLARLSLLTESLIKTMGFSTRTSQLLRLAT